MSSSETTKKLKMVEIDNNIAYRIGDTIYYNKNLRKYPGWYEQILDHECRHSGKTTLNDFKMDFFEGDFIKTIAFCLRHPKAFTYFSPISYVNKELAVDVNLLINYGIIIILLIIILTW